MMINAAKRQNFSPFILRFSEQMPPLEVRQLRYDDVRQIAQVQIDGCWVDTPDAHVEVSATTRITRVTAETTDDE